MNFYNFIRKYSNFCKTLTLLSYFYEILCLGLQFRPKSAYFGPERVSNCRKFYAHSNFQHEKCTLSLEKLIFLQNCSVCRLCCVGRNISYRIEDGTTAVVPPAVSGTSPPAPVDQKPPPCIPPTTTTTTTTTTRPPW